MLKTYMTSVIHYAYIIQACQPVGGLIRNEISDFFDCINRSIIADVLATIHIMPCDNHRAVCLHQRFAPAVARLHEIT